MYGYPYGPCCPRPYPRPYGPRYYGGWLYAIVVILFILLLLGGGFYFKHRFFK